MDNKPDGDAPEINDPGSESLLETIVRRSFRIPVKQRGDIRVTIEDRIFPVKDVSSKGVSITLPDDTTLVQGQFLSGCILSMVKEIIPDLKATVMHCSPDLEDGWLVGIQWLNLDPEIEDRISGLIMALRREFFEKEIMS
ncbi:MAG: PilZ domain-containing protein [Pseudomonadota bacterium]